jgi:four helix bundle protein
VKGDDIAGRLLEFTAEILRLIGKLDDSVTAKHVARQLTRAGTSGGANYEEARSAESRADFAHKVLVAAKEVRESVYWLRLIERAGLVRSDRLAAAIAEGGELVAILRASANTARSRLNEKVTHASARRSEEDHEQET